MIDSGVKAFGLTDVGQIRERNEDHFLIDDQLHLYMVCDGMGGHAAGEVASENATRLVADFLRDRHDQLNGAEDTLRLAEDAVGYASSQLYRMARADPSCFGMGTTLTMLILVGNKGVMAHVGDSRLYLRRNGQLHLLSSDHTLARELVMRGLLSAKQGKESRYSHVLTRSIGPQDAVEVDTLIFDLLPGDVFLLCTDGLTNYVEQEDELLEHLRPEVSEESARQLVNSANQRGGADNITTIVVQFRSSPDATDLDAEEFAERLEVMKSVCLFRGLSLSRLMRLMNITSAHRYRAGERIMSRGDNYQQIWVVVKGELTYGSKCFSAGDCFGAGSLYRKDVLHSHLVASRSSRVLSIQGDEFQTLTRRSPKLGRRLLTQLAKHLSKELQNTRVDDDMHDTWIE